MRHPNQLFQHYLEYRYPKLQQLSYYRKLKRLFMDDQAIRNNSQALLRGGCHMLNYNFFLMAYFFSGNKINSTKLSLKYLLALALLLSAVTSSKLLR